jgi:hypothetical protein
MEGQIMPNRKAKDNRETIKTRVFDLVRRYPGIEQRHLCWLIGMSLHSVKRVADELIREGRIERRRNSSGIAVLFRVGYRADRNKKMVLPKRQWNDCRIYQVPLDKVGLYRDPSVTLPQELRVDLDPEEVGG